MPFDKTRPPGLLTPVVKGAMYWQDGKHYDHDYNVVDIETGKILEPAPAPAKAKKAVGPEPLPPPRPSSKKTGVVTEGGEVSQGSADELVQWAKGDKQIQFFRVRQLVSEKHGVTVATAKEARKLILEK
jgi:hypothetical protein